MSATPLEIALAIVTVVQAIVVAYNTVLTRRNELKIEYAKAMLEIEHPEASIEAAKLMNGNAPKSIVEEAKS